MPWWFDIKVKSRLSLLWMHDVMDKSEFNKERLDAIDKVIFLSKFHAELYTGVVPKEKWFLSGNGIDPKQFEKYDGIERYPHRCIYTSSQVRGLDLLCEIWPDVRQAVPDAELHSYYGWKTFANANKENPERMEWMEKMRSTIRKTPGVYEHERVGHDEIARLMSEAGVWTYPTKFPEVYCISAVKAICAGCLPVSSDYACLSDYKQYSVQVHRGKDDQKFKEQFKRMLIKKLKEGAGSTVNLKQVREKFSWERTALGWDELMK
jgi:glycosyltransferase involved in cell wall biosynthesis